LDYDPDIKIKGPQTNYFNAADPNQVYNYNSSWFRTDESCRELSSETELVFAGCSFTEGIGVSEDMTWGSMLARKLDTSYSNLGKSGTSSYQIVKTLFAYFKEYGNPKYLACLFPDYNRFAAATSPNLFSNEPSIGPDPTRPGVYNGYANHGSRSYLDAPKYLKRPYDLNDVTSSEQAFMLNGVAISSLIQYCRATGIQFVWSTWSRSFARLIEGSDHEIFDFEGYLSIENTKWHIEKDDDRAMYYHPGYEMQGIHGFEHCEDRSCVTSKESCHADLYQQYPDNFHAGTDRDGGNTPHWGVHRHAHIAEEFAKALL
jgi:hypothetical protein